MSVIYNEKKNQVIYQVKKLDSDSDSDSEKKSMHSDDEAIEVLQIDNRGSDVLLKGIVEWQRIINDYAVTDIGEIIEQLIILSNDQPKNEAIAQALIDARHYMFQKSVADRKKVLVRKDLNGDQFGNRVSIDYDKSITDEQCRIVNEGHQRTEDTKTKPKLPVKPAPKNFGTKKYVPVLSNPKPQSGPSDWL